MKRFFTTTLLIATLALTGCAQSKPQEPMEEEDYQTKAPITGDHIAELETNHGMIKVKLFKDQAPETVRNFEELAKEEKYDNTIFHRIISDFMIQGGDFENRNGTGGYSYKGVGTMIEDEFSPLLSHIKGALSMANRGPNTGSSQFFIVHAADTAWLDGKHAIFGQVYEGMDIVDKIAKVETGAADKPTKDVILESVKIKTY
jgi:peptidyl-prolyl cis-trans isomerase B (cyclophilin B)